MNYTHPSFHCQVFFRGVFSEAHSDCTYTVIASARPVTAGKTVAAGEYCLPAYLQLVIVEMAQQNQLPFSVTQCPLRRVAGFPLRGSCQRKLTDEVRIYFGASRSILMPSARFEYTSSGSLCLPPPFTQGRQGRELLSVAYFLHPALVAHCHIAVVAAEEHLIAVGDDAAVCVDARVDGGFSAAGADGFYLGDGVGKLH